MRTCLLVGLLWFSAEAISAELARPQGPLPAEGVVALIGGAGLVAVGEAGYLETLLVAVHATAPPRFRDFSWEGDTVFSRQRPVNFPTLTNLLKRADTRVALLQFGQMESLAGRQAIPEFEAAYQELLVSVRDVVPRVVLLTPTAFTGIGPLSAEIAMTRNGVLKDYVLAIRRLGDRQNIPVINLFDDLWGMTNEADARIPFTSDGVQLTDRGQRFVAEEVALAWGRAVRPDWQALEPLRQAVVAKNQLWVRYWRPTNWAFLSGDRTEQPSSRDHRDRNIRWFPQEMEEYVPLLEAADAKIAQIAKQEATR